MSFINVYFKKKSNCASWQKPNNHCNKRKYDSVDVAVKKLKRVLVDSDANNAMASDEDVNKNEMIEKPVTNFPSFQLKSIIFMSKQLGACLCQCSEDGISIFLEDGLADDGNIVLKFSDIHSAAMETRPCNIMLQIKDNKVGCIKKLLNLEQSSQINSVYGISNKILRLVGSHQETKKAVEEFYSYLNNILNDVIPVSPLKSDDDICEEITTSTEIDVKSFYGKANNSKVEQTRNRRKCKETKVNKECSNCRMEINSESKLKICSKCQRKVKQDETAVIDSINHLANSSVESIKLFEYPPPPAMGRITFTNHDLACLEPKCYFNDVNIDFYLKFFHLEILSPEDRNRTHIFSSFFYSHLTSNNKKESNRVKIQYQRVQNWTRNVDIFSKDFIIIPINKDFHWFLAIICFPGLCGKPYKIERCSLEDDSESDVKVCKASCIKSDALSWIAGYESGSSSDELGVAMIPLDPRKNVSNNSDIIKSPLILIFDSLSGGKPRWDISSTLRQYLQMEWNAKKNMTNGEKVFSSANMKGCVPSCPQQDNHFDCGPYLLLYVQHFFMSPITNFNPPIKRLKKWFSIGEANVFRSELKKLVTRLKKEHLIKEKIL